jgi:hypothetical protein
MKTTPGILFQQKVFKTTGKPERELWFVPIQVQVFKYNPYLNISNDRLFGGVGKCEQINSSRCMDTTHTIHSKSLYFLYK